MKGLVILLESKSANLCKSVMANRAVDFSCLLVTFHVIQTQYHIICLHVHIFPVLWSQSIILMWCCLHLQWIICLSCYLTSSNHLKQRVDAANKCISKVYHGLQRWFHSDTSATAPRPRPAALHRSRFYRSFWVLGRQDCCNMNWKIHDLFDMQNIEWKQ